MNTNELQYYLFDKILLNHPNKVGAVDQLSKLLSVSKNSIYRRLRGDTLLTPDEIMIIARHFSISLDEIVHHDSNLIPFSYNHLTQPITDFDTFVNQIYANLDSVMRIPNCYVFYASQELPVFQYFFYRELLAFKLYVYGMTSWNFEFLQNRPFSPDLIPASALDKGKDCVRLYSLIPSRDLWTLNIVDNTLNQIEYIAAENRFQDPKMALELCDQVIACLRRARKMAETGRKFFQESDPDKSTGEFQLYFNEMVSTNNSVMVKTPEKLFVYTTINNPNTLLTSNKRFCEHMENWFNSIVRRSTSISVHSGKARSRFFNRLENKVVSRRKKIALMLNDDGELA